MYFVFRISYFVFRISYFVFRISCFSRVILGNEMTPGSVFRAVMLGISQRYKDSSGDEIVLFDNMHDSFKALYFEGKCLTAFIS